MLRTHNVLSASWTTKKVGSVIWSKLEGLRTSRTDNVIPGLKGVYSFKFQDQEILRTRSSNVQGQERMDIQVY